jgi:hypothetical protein
MANIDPNLKLSDMKVIGTLAEIRPSNIHGLGNFPLTYYVAI